MRFKPSAISCCWLAGRKRIIMGLLWRFMAVYRRASPLLSIIQLLPLLYAVAAAAISDFFNQPIFQRDYVRLGPKLFFSALTLLTGSASSL